MRVSISLVILLSCLSESAWALTFAQVSRVCPFTGTKFDTTVAASGYSACRRLDLKPIGAIAAPPPVPLCPDDGFVVYKEEFSPTEISTLREWIESDEFRRAASEESPYFRVALTRERLGDPADAIAWAYLQASWEVESDSERYVRYVTRALEKFEVVLESLDAGAPGSDAHESHTATTIVSAELLRRLGRFEEAGRRLARIEHGDALDPDRAAIVRYEAALIESGDSGRHYSPIEEEEEECSEGDRIPEWWDRHGVPRPGPTRTPPPDFRDGVALNDDVFVTRDHVSVRSGPTINAERIGTRATGDPAKILEKREQWCRIESESGERGWVSCVFLSRREPR